jgi:hypothetical protein
VRHWGYYCYCTVPAGRSPPLAKSTADVGVRYGPFLCDAPSSLNGFTETYPSFASFLHPIEFSKSKSVVIPVVMRSVAGIAGSNTDEGMDVRVLCLL